MSSDYSSEYFENEDQLPERKRKNSSPQQIKQNAVNIDLNENSHSDFVKSEFQDFSEFASENGTVEFAAEGQLFEGSDKDCKSFKGFDQSLIRLAYDVNGEGLSEAGNGEDDHEKITPSKKFKRNRTNFVSSASSESTEFTTRTSPVPNHIMSATGDTGWYEILQVKEAVHVMSTPDSNNTQPCIQKVLQTIDMSSIAQTTQELGINTTQPIFNTPVNHQSSLSQNGFVFTPHPRSGQVLYITDPGSVTPESIQNPKVQAVNPHKMNRTNVVTPSSAVSQIRTKKILNSGDENTSPNNTEKTSESVSNTSSPAETNDESACFPFLDSPQAMDEERESHNMKERKRRARIKEACDLMRQLVPGMSDKTDKATVFEFAARYIYYLKNHVGSTHDKNFLIKYSPY